MDGFTSEAGLVAALLGSALFGALTVYELGAERRKVAARMQLIVQAAAERRRNRNRLPMRSRKSASKSADFSQRVVSRLKLFSSKEAAAGRLLLGRAGVSSDQALTTYLFMRVSLPALFGLVTLVDVHLLHILPLASKSPAIAAFLATVAGYYAPSIFLNNKINKRQAELRKSLPDGLDLLVICIESGASINEAFARVGRELARGHAALAHEFAITAAELSFLPVRRMALENLLERTGLPGVRGLVTTMLQSERFGTPIAQALRVLSAEFRDQRMMAAETKAAKLPVLLTVPMMLFILPVLFIVLLGPAAISIMDAMGKA